MIRRTFVLLATTLALAACVGAPGRYSPFGGPYVGGSRGYSPLSTATPAGQGVAILAPLSGPNAERGQALVHAAEVALAVPGSPKLDVRDTAGTAAGAASAAQAAIAAGAGIIIGPLTAAETSGAAGPARAAGVPVLAFTNDPAQAQPGVWTLGITPAQQVRRLVGAMTAQGKTRFAAALPQNEFGQAMANALTQAVSAAGLPAPDIRMYQRGTGSLNNTVRDLSGYASRRGPLDAQIRAARAEQTADGRRRAAELAREPIPPAPFDALLLADTGESLATIAALLPYYDLDPPAVRVLGPALWAAPAARGGAALGGAMYAAPDPATREDFNQRYMAANGNAAPGLADFAYDAAAIARVLSQSGGFSVASLCRPEGFAGVDGLLALQPDGTVRRGLALFQIQRGGPVITEPAPDSLTAPGI
jgi:branched-chain amino acid transport system substrate-binding protein